MFSKIAAHIWWVIEHVDIIFLIILAIIGLLLPMGFIEISITRAFLFICGLVSLLAIALLLVLRKVEESKKLIASVVPKVEVELLEDRDAFYKKVEKEVVLAEKSIDVTHFYPLPTTKTITEKRYFETLSNIIRRDKIRVRRIASINNKENYEWVKSSINNHKDTFNYHVKYNSCVSDEFPFLNILIFDNKKVFVGVYQEVAMPEKAIFIDNETIAKAFHDYYQTVWVKSSDLKIGSEIFESTLNEIQEEIEGGAGR